MGKRGGKRGGRGRGAFGGGSNRPREDTRVDKANVVRSNERFEKYYNALDILPDTERDAFWEAMRRDLPNSFRFTGSKSHALAVQERLKNFYVPEIKSIQYEGQFVDAPQPVPWYPDDLAWFMTTPKNVIRRFKPFSSFQKFLVSETDVGNITRQEVVSMIPPLVIDIKPGMTVLDLCAAPGSKSAQLIEMIHAGEEDRARKVASNIANGLDKPDGEEFEDEGRSTGLLIANDVDYKRAHMLVHQMKRLSSPNIIVTNHDATIFPSIKIPAKTYPDGRVTQNRYLKFDRILADVPCSGDGTPRKNIEIWRNWTPGNGLGLHMTQVRILVRALQMLKVGGRVVYSTCSMNPVEDEAVIAAAINRCGGPDLVEMIETTDLLPGLKRFPGLKKWSIMDKSGRLWSDWAAVEKHRSENGDDGLSRLSETMFPPTTELPLNRAMRVYPHSHDTGAFFIAILEKKSEIKARVEDKPAVAQSTAKVEVVDANGTSEKVTTAPNGELADIETVQNGIPNGEKKDDAVKRKRSDEEDTPEELSAKRQRASETRDVVARSTENTNQTSNTQSTTNGKFQNKRKSRDQPFEEPFKYLESDIPELERIWNFYNISPTFPKDRFMVRNTEGTASKNIYYTTSLAKSILQENEGKGMKFVHCGVKMFVKQDTPSPEVCPWRIQTDGLRILETWVGDKRIVTVKKKETLHKLLIEMFPRFHDDDWQNLEELGDQLRDKTMGCCVLVIEPSEEEGGFSERMVFPLWKSIQSLNLMLPKEDRREMLLRLFQDDTPLVNMGQQKPKPEVNTITEKKTIMGDIGDDIVLHTEVDAVQKQGGIDRRNSSSPEPSGVASEDEEDGGVGISSTVY